MSSDKPMNPLEMLAYIIAQQIHDHEVVYIGTGIPMVAAILAKKHTRRILHLYMNQVARTPKNSWRKWILSHNPAGSREGTAEKRRVYLMTGLLQLLLQREFTTLNLNRNA